MSFHQARRVRQLKVNEEILKSKFLNDDNVQPSITEKSNRWPELDSQRLQPAAL